MPSQRGLQEEAMPRQGVEVLDMQWKARHMENRLQVACRVAIRKCNTRLCKKVRKWSVGTLNIGNGT